KMQVLKPILIVVEATGGYQRAVVLGLYEAGLPVAVVNPVRVRQYARASGLLAKTDKLDKPQPGRFREANETEAVRGKKRDRTIRIGPCWCVADSWKRC
ncbi:MAG: transposase, partial [Anaerolineales bacterium]|nr:transposase [Anaerolineales bacterium]